jgi:hypothetical protein
MKKLLLSFIIPLVLFSCKDKEDPKPAAEAPKAKVRIKLEHVFKGETLDFDKNYVTANGDTINIDQLKYFVSNFAIYNSESFLEDSYGYHLIDVTDESPDQEILIENLEPGTYDKFKFGIGVDNARNHSIEAAKGDLDPSGADQMIWSWNSGYKFIKFEGSWKSTDSSGTFIFHPGGDANYKEFVFGETTHTGDEHHRLENNLSIKLESGKTTEIHLVVDLAELFISPNPIDLEKFNRGHTSGDIIMNNIKTSDVEGNNGWFELHHAE